MAFNRDDPDDLLALKNEVNNDPDGLGYDVNSTQVGVLDVINLKRAAYIISKPKISSALIRSAVNFDNYDPVLADRQEWLRWQTGSNGFNEENMTVTPELRIDLADPSPGDGTNSIWQSTQRDVMNAKMLAILDVDGSRAEDLWGYGESISRDDWFAARDS